MISASKIPPTINFHTHSHQKRDVHMSVDLTHDTSPFPLPIFDLKILS